MKAKWKTPAPLFESIFALFPAVVADAPQWTADDTKVDPVSVGALTTDEYKEFRREMSNLSFVSDEEDNHDDDDDSKDDDEEEEDLRLITKLPGEFYEFGAEIDKAGEEVMSQTVSVI